MAGTTRRGTPGHPGFATGTACRDPELADVFFPDVYAQANVAEAKGMCRSCPAAEACFGWVVEHPQHFGVFAGLTPKERAQLRPDEPVETMRRLWAAEAFRLARKALRREVRWPVVTAVLGQRTFERALLVQRRRPDLVPLVEAGTMSLADAAVEASRQQDAA